MELTEDQIKEVNKTAGWDQGIFKEGYGIPVEIKEPCIYRRYETGGYQGGSCWDSGEKDEWGEYIDGPKRYESYNEPPKWTALETALKILRPKVTPEEIAEIEQLSSNNFETEYEYYGNSTDYHIDYIPLSRLYTFLKGLG